MAHSDITTIYLLGSALAFVAYGIDKAAAIGGGLAYPARSDAGLFSNQFSH